MRFLAAVVLFLIFSGCASKQAKLAVTTDSATEMVHQAEAASRRETLLTAQKSLGEEQQNKNSAMAVKLATRAKAYFNSGRYKKALPYYIKSLQLDASSDKVYYQYAVTLYKLKNYEQSGYLFQLLDGSGDVNQTELNYYQGLNAYKGQERDTALVKFKTVRDDNDDVLSPLASMYAGLIETSNSNYDDAKLSFEYVLDRSKDKDLDRRAENAVENLIQRRGFDEDAKRKWGYSIYAGAAYDGNVLNTADINAAPSAAAYRLMYGGNLSYKAIFTRTQSLMPQFSLSDMYSVDTSLKSDSTIQSADPLQGEISLPYRFTFANGALTVTPAYQVIYMSLTSSSRDLVFDSAYTTVQYTTSHWARWVSDYKLELAKDKSHIDITNPEDDQSATRYSAVISETKLLDSEGSKTIAADVLYTMNDTDGDNFRYHKYLIALGGGMPLTRTRKWLGYGRVDYYNMDFPDSSTDRSDKGYVLTVGANYLLATKSTVNLNLQYYSNDSSVDLYNYNKIVFSAIYQFNSGF